MIHCLYRGESESHAMGKPRERRETGEQDLFRARLDQILNMKHELVRLTQAIDWPVLEERFGAVYSDGPGMPPLPTRLMAGLAILKHTFDLSDEALCERWIENPYDGSDHGMLPNRSDVLLTLRSSSTSMTSRLSRSPMMVP
jgi:hypothetical protein